MAFYLMTTNQQLLQSIAAAVDAGEGYPLPGGKTLRYAEIDTHPDGTVYAYPLDDKVWSHFSGVVAAINPDADVDALAAMWERLSSGVTVSESLTVSAGPFAGVVLEAKAKGASWVVEAME